MQIFISWSGDASKRCAEALRDWLPYMNQAITPFVSSQDISKGERGLNKIANQLQECSFGIVCVTRDNQAAPWINFESGALSRELGESSLVPFLLDMPIRDLSGPLTQFQATDSSIEDDVWAMVKSINDKCAVTVDQERLKNTFERFWEDLTHNLDIIRKERPQSDVPARDTSEILNELVGLVREQSTRIGELESTISNAKNLSTHFAVDETAVSRLTTVERERDGAIRRRRASSEVVEVLGTDSVKNVLKVAGGLQVHCTQKSMSHAHTVSDRIALVADENKVSIDIIFDGSGEMMSFPAF
ncbi:toll/interleukin-1 receptor domain-containing protein [Streptomyces sp. ME109]|uniref:toll/interleukin-1 receptor domain-containing protein n=1 Tax=Streptomyces sp. me109 TaxID=1827853 RepID=UPI0016513250|nr:TIR domain-containing protein [Streptomyces sp. me109]